MGLELLCKGCPKGQSLFFLCRNERALFFETTKYRNVYRSAAEKCLRIDSFPDAMLVSNVNTQQKELTCPAIANGRP